LQKKILWLFITALSVRAIVAVIQMKYGIDNGLNFDQYLYGSFNPGLEIYHDFYGVYGAELADLSRGLIPYKDFVYTYPPLFLYSLYPFYIIGGLQAASIPIWLSDAATAPLIYLVTRQFASSRLSLAAGMAYAVSPFFLIYEGYLWFSSQPATFFMVLSLYFLVRKRPMWSAVCFAVAILTRQELIFLFPMYLALYLTRYSRSMFFKSFLVACSVLLAVSLPFLLISPGSYLYSLTYEFIPASFFGPLPSADNVSHLGSTLVSPSTDSLICTTLSNTWRSLACSYGNFTYIDVKTVPPWTTIFTAGFINFISTWIFFPLFGVTSYNFFRLRRDPSAFFLLGAIILTLFLAIFAFDIHQIYRYYLVPVYVMPLMISRARFSMSIAIALPILSLIFPSGFVQLLFPLIDCLMVLLLNQKSTLVAQSDVIPYSSPPLP
jgi:hypothetical protein